MGLERGVYPACKSLISLLRCVKGSDSVCESAAGRKGRKSRQSLTGERGGSLERSFIFCHILVPADCPGVTGG